MDEGFQSTKIVTEESKSVLSKRQKRLKNFAALSLGLLFVTSLGASIAYLFLWNKLTNLNELTNMYCAFFGFLTCTSINIIASFAGIVSLYEKQVQGQSVNYESHYNAVVLLLISGIIFNIVFPTTGLHPLEVDSKTRIPKIPLSYCMNDSKPKSNSKVNYPECLEAKTIEICLYCMYLLIIVELIGLTCYAIVRRPRKVVVIEELILNSNTTVIEETTTLSDIPNIFEGAASTSFDPSYGIIKEIVSSASIRNATGDLLDVNSQKRYIQQDEDFSELY